MQPLAYPLDSRVLYAAWEQFITTQQLDDEVLQIMDPVILRSWQRCTPRLDARSTPRLTVLDRESLERVLMNHFDLIAVARPVMEDIHQFVEGSGFVVTLADSSGCILDLLGDPWIVEEVARLGLTPGAYWDEGRMGTNGLALALLEAMPIQVVGPEHYFAVHHPYTCSAAPIHDVSGRIIGVLGMSGREEASHPHTLGIVMAAARAIENQLQTDLYVREANRRLAELKSIVGAVSDGLLAWNHEGRITHLNAQAGTILGLNPWTVVGRSLTEVLNPPRQILEAMEQGKSLRDVECRFTVEGRLIECLVSMQPIREGSQRTVGYIATLRRIEQVRRLVHRLVGAQATLTLDDLPGETPKMRQVRRQARIAARGTAPVLLRGEDGTGKNPLARAIHNESDRADGPFIAINCLSIPHELMASEFLGYEGGAFSGALAEGRPSKFELADGGTLFLDEIESLTLEVQAALLQVIETGHVMRLGGTHPIPVDVRIIAATSADLGRLVSEGSFRADLYHRFGAFIVEIPPLRERVEDIPLLASRLLARISRQVGRKVTLSKEALAALMRYPWPGNVREMENALERAVAMSEGEVIRLSDLPVTVRGRYVLLPGAARAEPVLTMEEAEREAIIRAGWACRGQVTQMAVQLGISRTTLWRKMKRFGLHPDDFKNGWQPRSRT